MPSSGPSHTTGVHLGLARDPKYSSPSLWIAGGGTRGVAAAAETGPIKEASKCWLALTSQRSRCDVERASLGMLVFRALCCAGASWVPVLRRRSGAGAKHWMACLAEQGGGTSSLTPSRPSSNHCANLSPEPPRCALPSDSCTAVFGLSFCALTGVSRVTDAGVPSKTSELASCQDGSSRQLSNLSTAEPAFDASWSSRRELRGVSLGVDRVSRRAPGVPREAKLSASPSPTLAAMLLLDWRRIGPAISLEVARPLS